MSVNKADDAAAEITLNVLTAVEGDSRLSQRALARRLGIALGLVNAYLKRCVKKGYIKVKQIPPNRYGYYLTPKGFSEKSRLTVKYLSISFGFFRQAREQCREEIHRAWASGWRSIALVGAGDLADIAALCAREAAPDLIIVPCADVDSVSQGTAEAIMIVDVVAPQAAYDAIAGSYPSERIFAPALLNISRVAPVAKGRRG